MFPISASLRGLLMVAMVACATLPLSAAAPRTPAANHVEHKVTRGETLWSIAQKHRTSVGAIMDFNHMPSEVVREGMLLRIPTAAAEDPRKLRRQIHIVDEGETFWSIADDYHISPQLLAKANPNINPNRVRADMELIIPPREEVDTSTPAEERIAPPATTIPHTVAEGETFYSIGRRYSVPMELVAAANPTVKPERLRAGMKIVVPSKKSGAVTTTPAKNKPGIIDQPARNRTHTVIKDESIASIAKKHGISETALLHENNLDDDDIIYVGDELKLPAGNRTPTTAQTPTKQIVTKTVRPSPTPEKPVPVKTTPAKPVPTTPAPPVTVGTDGTIRSYIISNGEDENTVCEAFGITKQQLFEYNRLSPGTKLKPGDEIAIPRVSNKTRKS